MATVVDEIPKELRAEVDAALAWLNREQARSFKVSGIVEPDEILARRSRAPNEPLDLSLILCEDDLCVRETVQVRGTASGIEVTRAEGEVVDPPGELDPAPGVRTQWLDTQLARYPFVVLVFYRGFW